MTTDADIIVVGGGMAGLIVALEAAAAGASVTVLEAGERTGGMLRRGRVAGIDVDLGAESFATRTDGVARLIVDFALADDRDEALQVVSPQPAPARLVSPIGSDGFSRMPLPRRTVIGVPADPLAPDVVAIIGEGAARRAAAEVRDEPVDAGLSLGALVAGRLGADLVERLVDPLCRSVYSQPADAAPLSRLHPKLWAEFVRTGSLLEAAALVAPAAAGGSAVAGISGGMWRLADAVRRAAESRGVRVRTGAPVRSVSGREPRHGGQSSMRVLSNTVTLASGEELRAPSIVLATGPGAAASLLGGLAPNTAPLPTTAPSPSAAVRLVSAVVRAPELAADPVGPGVIVAPAAGTAAKAMTHIDAKWQWARAALPEATHVVRLSARSADSDDLRGSDDVARELRALTGVDVQSHHIGEIVTTRWHDAVVPAATPEWTRAAEHAAERGIRLAGAVAAGTGLASVIPHARALAHDILSLTPARKEFT